MYTFNIVVKHFSLKKHLRIETVCQCKFTEKHTSKQTNQQFKRSLEKPTEVLTLELFVIIFVN